MSDDDTQATAAVPVVPGFTSPGSDQPPAAGLEAAAPGAAQALSDRPELVIAGAFAGGFLLAKLMRRRGN